MTPRTRHGARTFFIASLTASVPAIAICEKVQTLHHRPTGISVIVPAGYSATSESMNKDRDVTIKLTSKDSIANYCDLSFTRTTVPDKWARDKSKRTLHERYRTTESTERITFLPDPPTNWYVNPQIPLPLGSSPSPMSPPPPPPPIPLPKPPSQAKVLNVHLRALFNYISVKCSAKIEEYDKQRPIFEAVIKSIDIPY